MAASSSVRPMSSPKTYSAGTSLRSARAKARRTSSLFDAEGSARIPALAPPWNRSTAAHFHVIVRASRATSRTVRVGLIRVPPLPIPRAVLSSTRTPRIPDRRSDTHTTFSGPHSFIKERTSSVMASWPPFRDLVIVIRVCGGHCPAGHRRGRTVVALPPELLALACGAPRAPEADRIKQVPTWPEEVPARPRSRRSTYARLPERVWRAIAENSPPTAPIDLRAQSSRMDDLTGHAALGLALRMGVDAGRRRLRSRRDRDSAAGGRRLRV